MSFDFPSPPSDVVVALSGGIDSSVSAALLKSSGWNVHGLHLLLPAAASAVEARKKNVQKISEFLHIPLEIIDMRELFSRQIIDSFVDSYLKGLTPNPCIMCNQLIKFECLLGFAEHHNIQYVATGHYVRVRKTFNSGIELLRGTDGSKDQSYFLHRLKQKYLAGAIFPLGGITKMEATQKAHEMNLPCHSIPESQDICFLPGNDYRRFLENQVGEGISRKGDIINLQGEVVGEHLGAYRYTIGQRHGLGIASSRPYYVQEIRTGTNHIIVGRKEALYSKTVNASRFNWVGEMPLEKKVRVCAQVRYRHEAAPGCLEILSPRKVTFTFDKPQWAIAPGQSLCCYDGDRVMGGGMIG